MEQMHIKFRARGKAIAPQPIRLKIPGWSGAPVRRKNGAEPETWHCPPFVDASTYGLELIYPYDTECQVVNVNGDIRFEWDYAKEPGIILSGGEFGAFFPRPSKYYLFSTALDIQAPPGLVLRAQPHPRFYTDETGTVPMAMMGHVQTEWWSKGLFMVFRVPLPGKRHFFRKGDAYAQITFVPQRVNYEITPMEGEEAAEREKLEQVVVASGAYIARNVWHNPSGQEFKDHYKTMSRAFAKGGKPAVDEVIRQAIERQKATPPPGKSIEECLELAKEREAAGKQIEARDIYFHILDRDPKSAEANSGLGHLAESMGLGELAVRMMTQAIVLKPDSTAYRDDLGELLLGMARVPEAESLFESSLHIDPNDGRAKALLAQARSVKVLK